MIKSHDLKVNYLFWQKQGEQGLSQSRDLAGPGRTKPLWLSGDVIGFNNLSLWVDTRNETRMATPVFIIMNNPFWNKFCTLVMVVMVLLNSINMGAQLDISIIVKVLKKPYS